MRNGPSSATRDTLTLRPESRRPLTVRSSASPTGPSPSTHAVNEAVAGRDVQRPLGELGKVVDECRLERRLGHILRPLRLRRTAATAQRLRARTIAGARTNFETVRGIRSKDIALPAFDGQEDRDLRRSWRGAWVVVRNFRQFHCRGLHSCQMYPNSTGPRSMTGIASAFCRCAAPADSMRYVQNRTAVAWPCRVLSGHANQIARCRASGARRLRKSLGDRQGHANVESLRVVHAAVAGGDPACPHR